ncbi:MAG: tetratricopeptide repeat protein, partial [Stellaceae bacterium]
MKIRKLFMLAGLAAFALAGHAAAQSPAPANPPAPKALPMPSLSQASALCRDPTTNPNLRIAACDVVIQLNQKQVTPENLAIAYSSRCAAYQAAGQYDAANADCDQAIKLDPNNADTFTTRCDVLDNKGLYDDAIKDCDRATKLDPNYATAFY